MRPGWLVTQTWAPCRSTIAFTIDRPSPLPPDGLVPLRTYGTEGGVYDQVAPALVTTLATVVTLFTLLVTFITRDRLRGTTGRRGALRSAWYSLATAVVALTIYLALHQVYAEYAWSRWGWGSGDPRKLLAELPLMLVYVVFFSLLTRAFVLLGLLAFMGAAEDTS